MADLGAAFDTKTRAAVWHLCSQNFGILPRKYNFS